MYACWKKASFINECQISTLGLSLSVHTSVIPASVCPAYQLDHHVACRRWDAFWCLRCLAAMHVTRSHLQSAWRNTVRNRGLILFSRSVNASRLLASLAVSDCCWLLSQSVSAETRKPIYRIRRYVSAVNEYSPIYDIGLSLALSLRGRKSGAGSHRALSWGPCCSWFILMIWTKRS